MISIRTSACIDKKSCCPPGRCCHTPLCYSVRLQFLTDYFFCDVRDSFLRSNSSAPSRGHLESVLPAPPNEVRKRNGELSPMQAQASGSPTKCGVCPLKYGASRPNPPTQHTALGAFGVVYGWPGKFRYWEGKGERKASRRRWKLHCRQRCQRRHHSTVKNLRQQGAVAGSAAVQQQRSSGDGSASEEDCVPLRCARVGACSGEKLSAAGQFSSVSCLALFRYPRCNTRLVP